MAIHCIDPAEELFCLRTAHAFSVWFFLLSLYVNIRSLNSAAVTFLLLQTKTAS